jgi:hypothetical protein
LAGFACALCGTQPEGAIEGIGAAAAWADAGLAAAAEVAVPVFGAVALLLFVAVAASLNCARLGAFAGSLAWAAVSADILTIRAAMPTTLEAILSFECFI